jgi:VEFS-Box of polycomb protein
MAPAVTATSHQPLASSLLLLKPQPLRRLRVPFLRRNLPGNRSSEAWDTRWQPRGPSDARRSVLRVRAARATSGGRRAGGVLAAVLSVRFVDHSGRKTAFWTDAVDMSVSGHRGPRGSALPGLESAVEEVEFSFDMSAIVVFLRRFPESIVVALELYACAASQLRAPGHALRPRYVAEMDIFDSAVHKDGLSRQRKEVVPLVPSVGVGDEVGECGAATQFEQVAGPNPEAVKSALEAGLIRKNAGVVALDTVVNLGYDDCEGGKQIANGEARRNGRADSLALALGGDVDTAPFLRRDADVAGSVLLDVRGGPEWLTDPEDADGEAPNDDVHVMLTYYSPALPWWNGIVRRDFCCPWCNHDFRRLRALLVHFQSEHQNAKLMFDSLLDDREGDRGVREGRLPVVMNVSVFRTKYGVQLGNVGAKGGVLSVAPAADTSPASRQEAKTPVKVRQPTSSGSLVGQVALEEEDRKDTDNDDPSKKQRKGKGKKTSKRKTSSGTLRPRGDDNLEQKECEYCRRRFDADEVDPFQFCGEWCEVIYKNAKLATAADDSSEDEMPDVVRSQENTDSDDAEVPNWQRHPPLSQLTSRQRPRKLDYDATLGRRTLYHVITTTRFRKSHFDENDPDSEDEVDHSWRLQLSEDSLRELPLPPKHKVLWTMWNRFVFKDGSPGAYGDQYSQHAIELFVLEMAPEIHRLGLRVQMLGFLRAMHVHGCVDAEAIVAIVDCLDGRRKRRDCRASRRPKPPSGLAGAFWTNRGGVDD